MELDLERYPSTQLDLTERPELYNFTYNGYQCSIRRNMLKAWCGYVQLPDTHPDSDKDYDDLNEGDIPMELTYGEDRTYGFDNAHLSVDLVPGMPDQLSMSFAKNATYKDRHHTVTQVITLADWFKLREA